MSRRQMPLHDLSTYSPTSLHPQDLEWFQSEVLEVVLRETGGLQHGGWIYRGEPKLFESTSSTLFRKYSSWGDVGLSPSDPERRFRPDYNEFNADYVEQASRALGETNAPSVESRFRHVGGLSNKIDFSEDINIALFFACREEPEFDGRIVMLNVEHLRAAMQRTQTADEARRIAAPSGSIEVSRPPERDSASGVQKSVLIGHPDGYIPKDTSASRDIRIPATRKAGLLAMLRIFYGIHEQRVFPRLEDLAKRSVEELSHNLAARFAFMYHFEEMQRIAKTAGGRRVNQSIERDLRRMFRKVQGLSAELRRSRDYYPGLTAFVEELAKKLGMREDDSGVSPRPKRQSDGWKAPGIARILVRHNGANLTPWLKIVSGTGYSYEQQIPIEDMPVTIPSYFLHPEATGQCFIRFGCEGYEQDERQVEFDLSARMREKVTTIELAKMRYGRECDGPQSVRITMTTRVYPMGDDA